MELKMNTFKSMDGMNRKDSFEQLKFITEGLVELLEENNGEMYYDELRVLAVRTLRVPMSDVQYALTYGRSKDRFDSDPHRERATYFLPGCKGSLAVLRKQSDVLNMRVRLVTLLEKYEGNAEKTELVEAQLNMLEWFESKVDETKPF